MSNEIDDLDIDGLVSSYKQMKKVSVYDSIKAKHGELGSEFCSSYCSKCVKNGAVYITRNSPIREFFVMLPILNLFVEDYGFRLGQKALPNVSEVLKENRKSIKEIPLLSQAKEIRKQRDEMFIQFRRGQQ